MTSNCTLLPLLLWLTFWSASVWNTRYGSSSRTSYSALCAYSGQVAGFFIDSSQIVEQFHPGKRLVLFDWCLLFYWLLADRGAVSCRETIGFVWLIFLVARLCILYWLLALCADFVNDNSWFCLNDILTVIVSVLVRWKNAMSKKRHLAEDFSPDAIAGRLAEKNAYTGGSGRYWIDLNWLIWRLHESWRSFARVFQLLVVLLKKDPWKVTVLHFLEVKWVTLRLLLDLVVRVTKTWGRTEGLSLTVPVTTLKKKIV